MIASQPAVFLDRDGVLVEERDVIVGEAGLRILPGVPEALSRLHDAGLFLIVVTNQPIVARGLASEGDVARVHRSLDERLQREGGPAITAWLFCPHHPHATLAAYRQVCGCRKPRPGMLHDAARAHGIDTAASILVGDRLTDIEAGRHAGCRTVQVLSGAHDAPRILTIDPAIVDLAPDAVVPGLPEAADWILANLR